MMAPLPMMMANLSTEIFLHSTTSADQSQFVAHAPVRLEYFWPEFDSVFRSDWRVFHGSVLDEV